MNNKGKSNIIFIILIPLFIVIALLIVDTLNSYSENNRYKHITEDIIKDTMNSDLDSTEYYDEIKRLYKLNNYEVDSLVVDANDYEVNVINEHNYFSLLTSLKKSFNETSEIKILGITFKVKKTSKTIIKVKANKIDNEIKFTYEK